MMKNAFFMLKALLVVKLLKFVSRLFWSCRKWLDKKAAGKWLDKKAKVNFKIMTPQTGKQIIKMGIRKLMPIF